LPGNSAQSGFAIELSKKMGGQVELDANSLSD
jgi:hypothetical protein